MTKPRSTYLQLFNELFGCVSTRGFSISWSSDFGESGPVEMLLDALVQRLVKKVVAGTGAHLTLYSDEVVGHVAVWQRDIVAVRRHALVLQWLETALAEVDVAFAVPALIPTTVGHDILLLGLVGYSYH